MSVQITSEITLHTIRGPVTAKMAREDMPWPLEPEEELRWNNTLSGRAQSESAIEKLEEYLNTEVFRMLTLCTPFGAAGNKLRRGVPLPINTPYYPYDDEGEKAAEEAREALQKYCDMYVIPRRGDHERHD